MPILLGCSTKCHTSNFGAFESPNHTPLAELEVDIKINWTHIFNQSALERFYVETRMSENVALLRLFPTLNASTIEAFCRPPIEGIVLQTYGAGNAPSLRLDVLKALHDASKRGVLFLNITQCYKGSVKPAYATGQALVEIGVTSGYDLTPEAALMKLSYVLGKTEWDIDKKRAMLQRSLRGELHGVDAFSDGIDDRKILQRVVNALGYNFASPSDLDRMVHSLYPSLLCMMAKENNHHSLKALVETGAIVSSFDYDNRTPLHVACSAGSFDCVKYLLEQGAILHARDRFGNTPLIDAIRGRHLEIIEVLRKAVRNFIIIFSPC